MEAPMSKSDKKHIVWASACTLYPDNNLGSIRKESRLAYILCNGLILIFRRFFLSMIIVLTRSFANNFKFSRSDILRWIYQNFTFLSASDNSVDWVVDHDVQIVFCVRPGAEFHHAYLRIKREESHVDLRIILINVCQLLYLAGALNDSRREPWARAIGIALNVGWKFRIEAILDAEMKMVLGWIWFSRMIMEKFFWKEDFKKTFWWYLTNKIREFELFEPSRNLPTVD